MSAGYGRLYRVSEVDLIKFGDFEALHGCPYLAMAECGVDSAPTLDLDQSWPIWLAALETEKEPLSKLLKGDLFYETDGNQPDVGFSCQETVSDISSILNEKSEQYFMNILNETGLNRAGEIYLFSILREFYETARKNGNAIISLL